MLYNEPDRKAGTEMGLELDFSSKQMKELSGLAQRSSLTVFCGLFLFWVDATLVTFQVAHLQELFVSPSEINRVALTLLLLCAAVALSGLHLSALRGRSMSRVEVALAGIALIIGTVTFFDLGDLSVPALSFAGIVLCSAGIAVFFRFWFVLLKPVGVLKTMVLVSVSLMLGVLIGTAVSLLQNDIPFWALIVSSLITMVLALHALSEEKKQQPTSSSAEPPLQQAPALPAIKSLRDALPGFEYFLIGLFLLSALSVFTLFLLTNSTERHITGPAVAVVFIIAGTVSLGLSRVSQFRDWTTISLVFIVLLPTMSLAFGLLFVFPAYAWLALLVYLFGEIVYFLLTSYLLLRILTIYSLDWEGMVSLFGALLLAGFACGSALAIVILDVFNPITTELALAGCLFIIIFLVTLSNITPLIRRPTSSIAARHFDDDEDEGQGKWVKASKAASEDFLLTRREKEIFLLLAKGRNAEWISNELIISYYTAKTHINNIYRKLDIHRHEDLVAIIEEYKQKLKQ